MALYGKLDVDFTIALDSNYKNILAKFTDDTLNTIIRTDLTVYSQGVAQVAVSPGSFTVPMGDVLTGKILLLKVNQEVNVRLNGSVTDINVKPSGTYKGILVLHGEFTAILVTNAAATACQLEYAILGSES